MKTLLTALLLGLASASFSQCANQANIYSFSYGGHNYEIVRENKSWVDAATCAVERGGYLAEINDANEQNAIYNELANNAGITTSNTIAPDGGGASYVWIGGNDITTEGAWIWDGNNDATGSQFWQGNAAGSPVGGLYNNWGNEPDNYGAGQDGLGLALTNWPFGVASQWNDIYTSNTLYFVVEIESQAGLEIEIDGSFIIYPNPSKELLVIQNIMAQQYTSYLYDIHGKLILSWTIEAGNNTFDVSHLESGTYFLHTDTSVQQIILE